MSSQNKKHNKILKTNYFKMGMILSLTAAVSFLIWDQNESFATVLFTDDFSTDNFVDQDSAKIGVSGGVLNYNMEFDASNDASTVDLVNPLNDTNWTIKFKLNVSNVTTQTSNTGVIDIGMFDASSSTSSGSSQDAIVLNLRAGISSNLKYAIKDANNSQLNIGADSFFNHTLQVETIWVELKRTSSTTYEATLFSDAFITPIETQSGTVDATVDNLQYFGLKNRVGSSDPTSDIQGFIDDLEISIPNPFCNGVESTIVGTSGNDILNGTSGDDVIVGLGGNDYIVGKGGDDIICGGDGADTIRGSSGKDIKLGEDGADLIMGDSGDDILKGGDGNDVLLGGSGDDDIEGNADNDTLVGNSGDDDLDGNTGTDICDVSDDEDNTVTSCETKLQN